MNRSPTSKRALRRLLRAELAELDPRFQVRAAEAVAERVLRLPEVRTASRLISCLSFGVEIDTWPLVDQLVESGCQVFVPRADFDSRRLHLHSYPCELESLPFGLRQPVAQAPELPPEEIDATIEAALILGLAFDHSGFRLGHGGGFFDRFLSGRRFPAIGLAYDRQLVGSLAVEPHDLPMQVVVTEHEVLRPT